MADMSHTQIHQYLTFKLAGEAYAINVGNIKEVLGVPKIAKVPKMPEFMSGIINLRGSVVPVIDLCRKFGLGETSFTVDTAIIVTEIDTTGDTGEPETLTIGVFSDAVEKVVTIEPAQIEPPPKIGIAINTDFIRGMGHVDGSFIIILNINKILSGNELEVVKADTAEGASDGSLSQ